jgi:single-stranded DNA-binding protein
LLKTRIKNEVEKGKMLEIEAKAKTGQYVDARDVERQAFYVARTVRDSLQNIPDRVSSLLASISDANQIYEILSKEIRIALEGLSEELQ